MTVARVLLLGGSGFIGSTISNQLARIGVAVTIPTREPRRAAHLTILPQVHVVGADIFDRAELRALLHGHDAVINLVGILHGDFQRVHSDLARMVAEVAVEAGVHRLVHMSALNANAAQPESAPSAYLVSKGRGEAAIRAIAAARPALKVTIFQPSVVFGPQDRFLNMFAGLVRALPVIPLGSAEARFQPVWVEDVARAFVSALHLPAMTGQTWPLVGPRVYTLRELMMLVAAHCHKQRLILPLGPRLAWVQAAVFEHLPGKLLTRDNVLSMRQDNTSEAGYPAFLGAPAPLEAIAPGWLGSVADRDHYADLRTRAGR